MSPITVWIALSQPAHRNSWGRLHELSRANVLDFSDEVARLEVTAGDKVTARNAVAVALSKVRSIHWRHLRIE